MIYEHLRHLAIGGVSFYVKVDPNTEPHTLIVRDDETAEQLAQAIAKDAAASVVPTPKGPGTIRTLHEPEPVPVTPANNGEVALGRTGRALTYVKFQQLGGSRQEFETAIRQRGNALTPTQRTVLSLALQGRAASQIALDLNMPPTRVNRIRQDAARALGFTPKHYPKLSASTMKAAANRAPRTAQSPIPPGAKFDDNGIRLPTNAQP